MELFTHLHTHSYYSFLDGILSPAQLAAQADAFGMESLGLTDHNGLSGAIEFVDACQKYGIKPIIGIEISVQTHLGKGNLVLLCKDLIGWSNLSKISTILQCNEDRNIFYALPYSQLKAYRHGLICLSGGKRGYINQLIVAKREGDCDLIIREFKQLFQHDFYIEIQHQSGQDLEITNRLAQIGNKYGIPLLATNNVHYISNDQAALQRTVCAIKSNSEISTLPESSLVPEGSFFASGVQMSELFRDYPESIENTQVVTQRCNLELPLGVPHYPKLNLPKGKREIDILQIQAKSGAIRKYGKITHEISKRIDRELEIIHELGYASLFLIVKDILDFARNSGVPISSRGSAASSLVAHCLDITSPDPLALNLYFERFLNPARKTPPDIDTDLCSKRRDKVIEYVYEKYGNDRVAMVATINRFQKRSALREVAKVLGFDKTEIKNLVDRLSHRRRGPQRNRNLISHEPYEDLRTQFAGVKYEILFRHASAIIGFPRHLSVHPGGIVISPCSITELVPLHLANKGIRITQFDLEAIEKIGLVKIDLLGTRGLSVLGDVAEQVYKWRSTEYKNRLAVLNSIPIDEPGTSSMLQSTNVIGCFAIESPGMRHTLREIDASTPDDIMIALALYRPGPMTGGLKDAFIDRHLGREEVEHLHPSLEKLLSNTHGVILYQEQVLRIASELAGLNLSDADLLRRAMSHFDPGDRMKNLKTRFIQGAKEKSLVPVDVGEEIWELMAAFAGYGFPKAHAASYAEVAWKSVWCKTHFPAEFMAAVISGGGGYYRQYVYINEIRRMGLPIRPPNINLSDRSIKTLYPGGSPTINIGLNQIKGLSTLTQSRILANRPYKSLDDFLTKVNPKINEATNLIKVGALEDLGIIPEHLNSIKKTGWKKNQPSLFPLSQSKTFEDWDLAKRVEDQINILGIGIDSHPVELLNFPHNQYGAVKVEDTSRKFDDTVRVIGIRQTIQRFHSSSGMPYFILELDDPSGVLHVKLTEKLYQENRKLISPHIPFLVEGIMIFDEEYGMDVLSASKITLVDQ